MTEKMSTIVNNLTNHSQLEQEVMPDHRCDRSIFTAYTVFQNSLGGAVQARSQGGCEGCGRTPPQTAEVHFFRPLWKKVVFSKKTSSTLKDFSKNFSFLKKFAPPHKNSWLRACCNYSQFDHAVSPCFKIFLTKIASNSLWCSSFARNSKDGITSGSEGGIFRGHWHFGFKWILVFFEDEGFILVILILQAIQKSSISTIFSVFINFFEKIRG